MKHQNLTSRNNGVRPESSAVHLSVCSIRSLSKFDTVVLRLSRDFDIIVFSETWLRPEESVFFGIDGYERLACCRDTRGGGLMIFIKKAISIIGVQRSPLKSTESISAELTFPNGPLTLTAIYKPPTCSVNVFIEELDGYLGLHRRHVLLGDININFNARQDTHLLGSILTSCGYESLIDAPARYSPPRALDHIFANVAVASAGTLDLRVSDHHAVWCKLPAPIRLGSSVESKRTNIPALTCRLALEPWSTCLTQPVWTKI